MGFLRVCIVLLLSSNLFAEGKVLHLYTWYNYIPLSLIKKFEEQTGIKVYMDFFESSDMLESQLLVKNSGYDLVVPGAYPYGQRHIAKGLYQKIDLEKIPNHKFLDAKVLQSLQKADPEGCYLVPYIWGIVGIGINRAVVDKVLPDFQGDALDLIFDPECLRRLQPYGVYLIDDPLELFAAMFVYLGLSPDTAKPEDFEKAYDHLHKIRPYIRRFDMYRGISDFANNEVAVVHTYNMHVALAKDSQPDKRLADQLEFILPKQGVSFWVDCFAIPADAKNVEEAHKFLGFILDPKHSAEVIKVTGHPTANQESLQYLPDNIKKDATLFPDLESIDKIYVATSQTRDQERRISRLMMKLKTGY